LNRSAARTVCGAIYFNSPTHLPPSAESRAVKPVMLPPGCARLATKPLLIGSTTIANTIGIVRVSRARALITGVVTPRIASGRRSTSSFANFERLSHGKSCVNFRPCFSASKRWMRKYPLPWTRDFHHDFRCASQIREKIPPASFFNRRAASFLLALQMRLQLSRLRVPQRHVGRHGDRTLPTLVPHLRRWNS